MNSRWTKLISQSGNIRIVAVEAATLISEISSRHSLTVDLTQGIGEATLAGLLIASSHKSGERVNLSIQSSGKWKQAVVDAYPEGYARGFISAGKPGDWQTTGRGPWGNGLITVLHTKSSEGNRPYSGTVALETGFLEQDLAFYWNQSEQIPSVVGMHVTVDANGLTNARAVMAQAITGITEDELKKLENSLEKLQKLAATDLTDLSAKVQKIFGGEKFTLVEDTPLEFRCNCSAEKVEEALLLTGAEDLRYMLGDRDNIEVKCDFCSQKYTLNRAKVQDLLRRMSRGNA
ncbi:MAG: Hsp33 family molecular chaperone HslO [Bdellovibrionia bacterium]